MAIIDAFASNLTPGSVWPKTIAQFTRRRSAYDVMGDCMTAAQSCPLTLGDSPLGVAPHNLQLLVFPSSNSRNEIEAKKSQSIYCLQNLCIKGELIVQMYTEEMV